jgi:hypothetical protein
VIDFKRRPLASDWIWAMYVLEGNQRSLLLWEGQDWQNPNHQNRKKGDPPRNSVARRPTCTGGSSLPVPFRFSARSAAPVLRVDPTVGPAARYNT